MIHDILFVLWFFIPAALANIAPIPIAKTPLLKAYNAPMDFGRTFRGQRILGPHKTWRGLIAGAAAATLTLWLQQLAVAHLGWARWLAGSVDYQALPTLLLGSLFAIGVLGGDALESFFKRQRGIPSGHTWFPWDQLDCIIGALIVSAPFVGFTASQYVWGAVLWFLIHLGSTYVGWLLGLKERPI